MIKETYILFLDDIRKPKDCCRHMPQVAFYWKTQFEVVRNYESFVQYISTEYLENGRFPNLISFDHDLSLDHYAPQDRYHDYDVWLAEQDSQEKTGMDCAKWLVEFCMEHNLVLPEYIVHSMNPSGADNIMGLLNSFRKHQTNEHLL